MLPENSHDFSQGTVLIDLAIFLGMMGYSLLFIYSFSIVKLIQTWQFLEMVHYLFSTMSSIHLKIPHTGENYISGSESMHSIV